MTSDSSPPFTPLPKEKKGKEEILEWRLDGILLIPPANLIRYLL
jgi:hypothetical protein